MALPVIATDVIKRIVLLAIHDIPQVKIAEVVGLSDGRITQIMEMDIYKELYAEHICEKVEGRENLNIGWDALENLSVSRILEIMETTFDPDYALRVAAVANKAQRRGGSSGITPINGDAGVRTIIHLTQTFIHNLQSEANPMRTVEDIPQKQQDFLDPAKVDKLLMPEKKDQTIDLIPEFKGIN